MVSPSRTVPAYPAERIREVDEAGLRAWLEALPCCTLGGDHSAPADPMNIAVIGAPDATFQPFIRQGWDVTETIHSGSVVGTALSSVFKRRYCTSPVSPLYVFGRPQDIALQKARQTVDERNHLRLWLAPLRYAGMEVWVGQISRDIGVRMSRKTFVTHKIDPDVDEARYYLLQDLAASGFLAKVGHVSGVGFAGPDDPRGNYTGDPYFGLRVVLFLSDSFVPFDELHFLRWEDPAAFVRHFRPGALGGESEQ